ncbi:Flp pilus assembly protein CpaB [Pseudomonas asplenii]|uniref:Flp pilus assembly protein CpaB n=1 Tax=Pseudomonas asplenii TaxID=53407 RepID=UPI0006B53288|nr:Flp pilus assembly protein CpaB [Pseudomonas fuscovaginae]KPA95439.1 Flp pilus assembly protein CpaB [Pseudomonas fuscovaginae]
MNSRVTMGLAAILLIAALVVGYWGLMLSHPPAPVVPAVSAPVDNPAAAEDPARQPVVVLAHDVPPFVPLTAADLVIERLRIAPPGSFGSLQEAVDRIPWRPLKAGTWLSDESFQAGGPLARMIRSDERALAVAVDEVIGAGGQLTPGDYVDVLLFLRQDASNLQQSAQVVIPAMRLLSVGEQLGLTNDGKPASGASASERANQELRRASARTVVLAVPEPLLSRLMLATQVGTLRLAVRSADEHLLPRYWAGEKVGAANLKAASAELFQFNQLALAGAPRGQPPVVESGGRGQGAVVIRGNQVSQSTP